MPNCLSWSHYNPVRIVSAPLDTLAQHVVERSVLLVTTPGFVKRGMVQRVKDILASVQVTVWDGVKPNPDLQDLDEAARSLRGLDIDCVVGLGGGSALDAAKVLATTIPSPAAPTLSHVFGRNATARWVSRLSLVAIPTTAGTGAEVTPFATVWDHAKNKKHSLAGDFAYPDLALLDATLTLTLGREDTLYPALDAISHALESLWNKNCTPVSRALALQALKLSNVALPLVLKEPTNYEARQNLQTASVLAGLAISQTRTAIAHSISYPLTLRFGVPHGLACSYTLPRLITHGIKHTVDESFRDTAYATKQMLIELNLDEQIKKYVSKEELTKVVDEIDSPERMANYSFTVPPLLGIILDDEP